MTPHVPRRAAVLALFWLCACAGGPPTRLRSLATPTGQGAVSLEVHNGSETVVNNLYLAPTAKVNAATREVRQDGSPELWGADLLTRSALEVGGKLQVPVPGPGSYDIRALSGDGRREQHIGRLRLEAGGRYVLELGEAGWRPVR